MRNIEIKILYRVFAILGTILVILVLGGYLYLKLTSPHLLDFSKDMAEEEIKLSLEELEGSRFIGGMNACENIYLVSGSHKIYVTDLQGYVYLINGQSPQAMEVTKSIKLGEMATGIDFGPDGWMYVGVTDHDVDGWKTDGGYIVRIDTLLEEHTVVSGEYPSLNGLAFDDAGRLFLTSSNFNPFDPDGRIFVLSKEGDATAFKKERTIDGMGMANGLYFHRPEGRFYASHSVDGVYSFQPGDDKASKIYNKTRFLEMVDDLCLDNEGNIWMTDPGHSTIKRYKPGYNELTRFIIKGIGQASSCRIRIEGDVEVMYITELKTENSPMTEGHDGRGVFRIPLRNFIYLYDEE